MDYDNRQEEIKDSGIDYISIGRTLLKNIPYILMLAFTFGICFFRNLEPDQTGRVCIQNEHGCNIQR